MPESVQYQAVQKWNSMSVQEKMNIAEHIDRTMPEKDWQSECIKILAKRLGGN